MGAVCGHSLGHRKLAHADRAAAEEEGGKAYDPFFRSRKKAKKRLARSGTAKV
jgi:hypothetical protein